MPKFTYSARDASGNAVSGTLQTDTRSEALAMLRAQALIPLDLRAEGELPRLRKRPEAGRKIRSVLGGSGRVSLSQKSVFCRQLAISVNAGVSLRESLESIAADEDHPSFRTVQNDMIENLHAGKTFSEALARHKKVFPPLFVALIRAAEEAGSLPETLEQLATSLERSERLAARVRSITAYPVFVAIFFLVVCLIMTIFVLPRFENIFAGFNAKLPLLTRIVFGANKVLVHYLPVGLVALAVCVAGVILYGRTAAGQAGLDRFKLAIPFFGSLVRKFAISRFCRNMAIMVQGGVPVATAMEMSAATSGNKVVERALIAARERIVGGAGISASLDQDKVFPRMVVRMVNVGESSGRLPNVLERVAEMYDAQVEAAIMTATALFEPIVICLFGAVVLVLVLAIYVPVFSVAGRV